MVISNDIYVYIGDERIGFKGPSGSVYLQWCPSCKKANPDKSFASGVCAWCRWDANNKKGDE